MDRLLQPQAAHLQRSIASTAQLPPTALLVAFKTAAAITWEHADRVGLCRMLLLVPAQHQVQLPL